MKWVCEISVPNPNLNYDFLKYNCMKSKKKKKNCLASPENKRLFLGIGSVVHTGQDESTFK